MTLRETFRGACRRTTGRASSHGQPAAGRWYPPPSRWGWRSWFCCCAVGTGTVTIFLLVVRAVHHRHFQPRTEDGPPVPGIAKVLLDQQLVNLTDARQELIETETRDGYYLRLHNIDVTLTRLDAQTSTTADQLTELIQKSKRSSRRARGPTPAHGRGDVVTLKRAERQRRVRNTVDRKALAAPAGVRAVRIAVERASLDEDSSVERHKAPAWSRSRRSGCARWRRGSTRTTCRPPNDHRPPHWTDAVAACPFRH